MAATNKIMVMRPETVARTAPGLDHSPLLSCCHRRLTNIILNFCHLCSRRWQPSSNPQELFRQNSPFLVTAPHQTGARNSAHTRPKPDKAKSIVAGTALVGRAASRATTRANPTISRDPSSCSSTWPTSGERTPRDAVNPSPQFRGLSKV
jgi:hypothetical protein